MRNATLDPIGLPVAGVTEVPLGLRPIVVGSNGAVGGAGGQPPPSAVPEVKLRILAPGALYQFVFDLTVLFGVLPDDIYTVFVRYAPSPDILSTLYEAAAIQGCILASGPVVSEHLRIRVRDVPGSPGAQDFARVWRSQGPREERWRALRWLAHNALPPGTTKTQVIGLLGPPSQLRGGAQWVYAIGAVGIIVTFSDGRVDDVVFFET